METYLKYLDSSSCLGYRAGVETWLGPLVETDLGA